MSENSELEESRQLQLQFKKRGGILPVIVQENKSGEILMLGYVNKEAFDATAKSGLATFWSTSRNRLWVKGETSGNELHIIEILVDCDQDALIYKVQMNGEGSCHTKNEKANFRKTCFYRSYNIDQGNLTNTDP